ncbi:MAG: hypothetical protein A3J30_03100 [Candidatus Wildermuthbacteria bacterium RIFCSPLOWO2_02_FULL_47_9c]|uniref:Dehydrogenase E1 component n=3 Tax=Parcubacteria group TaxID=1794811 RepID=A0A837IM84_9BACT|nr:MAG: dehydrogenase E1 component [Candidatus Yanofskybacteria bacterium GW2011_GWC1_48_11]KKW04079.1 MAG: dehydrogenase E1 component [Parcubacteria group bacterium GW2011_GWB1_49_12]KKW08819.1 MAG: dehydrogenase E1 component [Parcubacteria group bacterium GW2011_GWA1_49_26]OHA61745.1 MAG: hypothetical protein A2109_00140 [Candidatus Wildermuthbacteria bacterium GWA1_49_26]OHA65572.1 MAG: hypothetical protein A2674_03055 [Candidatus Wildermuthbacteria bacterium RIFCSPHIGHO2_01_FULL_50_47]OHA6
MLKLHLEFYKKLYLIRRAEEKIREHYSEDEMKTPMHMSMGEEAIVVGVLEAAGKKSQAFGTYRSHALYLAKTGESDMFFAEMYGKAAGPAKGKAGSMHIALPDAGVMMTSAVVGTTIPVALGAALANAYLKNKRVVVSFFGDGAVNEGVFWESLNFACLKKLPILFVCEDNDFAIHSRLKERLGHKPIAKVASQFYCHTDAASTTDVYEIYEMTRNMLAKMEKSGMPGFLHMKYYRYLEHVGVNEDFDAGYRARKELLPWMEKDPVKMQRDRLIRDGIKENAVLAVEKKIDEQLEKSIREAQKAPFPKKEELMQDVYA